MRRNGQVFVLVTGFVLLLAGISAAMLRDIAGHFAAPAIAALQARGLLHGTGANRFEPDGPLTRAQVAKLFVTALDQTADAELLAAYDSRFADVPKGHWAAGFIEVVAEMGIAQGYPGGTFLPDATVTRAELTVMLVRAAGLESETIGLRQATLPYVDADEVEVWARRYVAVAHRQGLLQGFPDGTFRPGALITRAESALIMTRLLMMRGSLFHLAGTLTARSDTAITVRDALGQQREVPLAADLVVYRGGVSVPLAELQLADQVWVVVGPDGSARFIEARYQALEGQLLAVIGQHVRFRQVGSEAMRELKLEPGALVFLNGRPASVGALTSAQRVYLVLNQATGEVRIADGVAIHAQGELIGVDTHNQMLYLETETGSRALPFTADALFFVNGRRTDPEEIFHGDHAAVALDAAGKATYVEMTTAGEE